jgi:hypothetical protein
MRLIKILITVLGLAAFGGLVYYTVRSNERLMGEDAKNTAETVVNEFGSRLKNVSLLSPEEALKESIRENYGELITPELLSIWENDPSLAPGRVVSSPWPEKIDIYDLAIGPNEISVGGSVVEATSAEPAGDERLKRPINIKLTKEDGKWLISEVKIGEYEEEIIYRNDVYGFSFSLPFSWEGYSVIQSVWNGNGVDDPSLKRSGGLFSIRHPEWTTEVPRQDIPIMVFTISQWDEILDDKLSVGAAPIHPSELGRNGKYVFALPARYNFAFPKGFEEVEEIIKSKPFHAF